MAVGILAAGPGPLSIQGGAGQRAARWRMACLSVSFHLVLPRTPGTTSRPKLHTFSLDFQFPSQLPPPPPFPPIPLYRLLFFLFVVLSLHLHVRPCPIRQSPFSRAAPRQVPPSRFEASFCLFLRALPPASEQRSRCLCLFRFSLCYPLFSLVRPPFVRFVPLWFSLSHPRNFLPSCLCQGTVRPAPSRPCARFPGSARIGHLLGISASREQRTGRLPPLHLFTCLPRRANIWILPMFWLQ